MGWTTRFGELIGDWVFVLRRGPFNRALPAIAGELLALPYRSTTYHLVARPVHQPLPAYRTRLPLTVEPLALDHLQLLRRVHRPSEVALACRRLAAGQEGFSGLCRGEVTGYAFVCTDSRFERLQLPLEPGDVQYTDAFTAPRFRGQGVQLVLLEAVLRFLRNRGSSRLVAYVDASNRASESTLIHRMGFEIVASLQVTRTGIWRRTVLKPVPPTPAQPPPGGRRTRAK